MECWLLPVMLLNFWELAQGDELVQTTKIDADIKQQYDMTPEVVDKLVLLAEQDRNILKTILTNQAVFYENFLIPTVLLSYNASHSTGNCALSEERRGKNRIRESRKLLEARVDAKIDGFLREWTIRQTQPELEEYYLGHFWTDRAALYDYVSTKNRGVCENPNDENKCTGMGVLEREAGVVMKKISNCKAL